MNLTSNSLETVQPITEVSFITRLLSALRPDMVAAEGVTSSHQDASPERFRAVTEIPQRSQAARPRGAARRLPEGRAAG